MLWRCLGCCCRPIPQRFVVATMVLLALSVQYIDRMSFNLAITEITHRETEESDDFEGSCPYERDEEGHAVNRMAEFNWTIDEQANLLGSFYFGYIVTHLPGGIISDWYGPKRVLGLSTFLSGLCVLLTPMCARMTAGTFPLLVNRVVMGLAQGPLFPAISSFVARWSTPNERNFMCSYMNMGANVGAITSNLGTGFLLYYLDSWDTVFYIYGVLTMVFCVIWCVFVHDSPIEHPFITDKEKEKLVDNLKDEVVGGRTKLPIVAMVKSVPLWAVIVANVGHDWKFYIVISLLPQYISYVLHMNILENGLVNSAPFIGMFIFSMISAKLAEVVLKRGWLSMTNQCKIWTLICNMIPCTFFILASFSGCNLLLAVAFFILAFSFVGFAYASIRVVTVHMAPNYAGFLMSIMNATGSLGGMFGPKVFAFFTEKQSVTSWRMGFVFSFVLVGVTTLIFLLLGTAEIQAWNDPTPRSSQEEPPQPSDRSRRQEQTN